MSENNNSENYDDTTRLVQLNSAAVEGSTKADTPFDKNIDAAAKALARRKKTQQKFNDAASETVDALVGMTSSLATSSPGSFDTLNRVIATTAKVMGGMVSAIPYVGGALKGLAEGASQVAQYMVKNFSKAFSSFEKLSDTGVISTFDQLIKISDETGLNLDDINQSFGKYSKQLAVFGGNAERGVTKLLTLTKETANVNREFQNIGLSASEFIDIQMNYIESNRLTMGFKLRSEKQLQTSSVQYIERLDDLSKMTGVSRKELEEQARQRMKNVRYLAGIATLSEDQKAKVDNLVSVTASQASEGFGEGLEELFATRGIGRSDKGKSVYALLSAGGMDVAGDIQKVLSGGMSEGEFYKNMKMATEKSSRELSPLIKIVGDTTEVTSQSVGAMNLAVSNLTDYDKAKQDAIANRKKTLGDKSKIGADAAETRRNMYSASRQIEMMSVQSKVMTRVMQTMASGIDDVTSRILESKNEALPDYLKLRMQKSKIVKETNALEDELEKLTKDKNDNSKFINKNKDDPKFSKQIESKKQDSLIYEDLINKTKIKIKEQEQRMSEIDAKQALEDAKSGAGRTNVGPTKMLSYYSDSGSSASAPSGATGATGPAPAMSSGLGSLAEKYESSGMGTATVGKDQNGGTSYGRHQIATKVGAMDRFLSLLDTVNPDAARRLRAAGPADAGINGRFAQEWRKLASEGALQDAESQFTANKIYAPAFAQLSKPGLKEFVNGDRGLQELLFSSAIQHGYNGAPTIFNKVYNPGMSKQDFVRAVFEERKTYLSKQSPNEKQGVLNRYRGEQSEVLAMLGTPPVGAQAAAPVAAVPSTGGLVRAPSTGATVMLQGKQAVVPANAGSEQSFLDNNFGSEAPIQSEVVKLGNMMNSKLDSMISVAQTNLNTNKQAQMYGVN